MLQMSFLFRAQDDARWDKCVFAGIQYANTKAGANGNDEGCDLSSPQVNFNLNELNLFHERVLYVLN